MAKPPGVYCLEGIWEESFEARLSSEATLRLLHDGEYIRLIHRDVATRAELEHYLNTWHSKGKKAGFRILLLMFHGSPSTLHLGMDDINLQELAELLEGRCNGVVIHFGACGVLRASDSDLKQFCAVTGAKAVVGYTADVGHVEAAAFELLLVERLAWSTQMKSVYTSMTKTYPDLTSRLGFRMAHSTWASDRRIALNAFSRTD